VDLEESLQERIQALIDRKDSRHIQTVTTLLNQHDDVLQAFTPHRLAARVARTIHQATDYIIAKLVHRSLRTATLARFPEKWPFVLSMEIANDAWNDAYAHCPCVDFAEPDCAQAKLNCLSLLALALLEDSLSKWPPNVTIDEVAQGLERIGMYKARDVVEWSQRFDRPPSTTGLDKEPRSIMACALVLSAAKEAAESQRKGIVLISSTQHGRAAVAVVSQGSKGPWDKDQSIEQDVDRYSIALVWNGRPRPVQLSLNFPGPVDSIIVKGILDELEADGLRDYLVLHRMAAEQGRTGVFTWAWTQHRELTAYAKRVASSSITDESAAAKVTYRLWRLKNAELRHETRKDDDTTAWVRVGPFGLIDIPAGINRKLKDGDSLEKARIVMNPNIYAGAHCDSSKPHFALLPNEVLALDGKTLRLATLLSLSMRYAFDNHGVVSIATRDLWEYLNTESGQPKRKRWQQADTTLRRALDRITAAGVIGSWNPEGSSPDPLARYTINPAAWWKDLVIHHVPIERPTARLAVRNDLPKTGKDLRVWRAQRGMTQAQTAAALGVGLGTIKRAELSPDQPIVGVLAAALANYRDPKP
jgi:hypothetical protein